MQTMDLPQSGATQAEKESFNNVLPVDVARFTADQADAIAAFHERLDRKKKRLICIGATAIFAWIWVEFYGGPYPATLVLFGLFLVAFCEAVSFDAAGPGGATRDEFIPETQLLAILTNGLPDHLSTDLVEACRKLAEAQSGRLLRSQFRRLSTIDQQRRLQEALAGHTTRHRKASTDSMLAPE